ncbi:hypothetical protein ABGV42_00175 [Paenibacillus pabuli]|uniref:hypothetical protein n=1 Tax=Paenibacillus pabuli TaxID=1472 RepID=UPI003242F818
MDNPIYEVVSSTLAFLLLLFMFTLIDSSANTASLMVNRTDGLEKVKYDTTIDNVTTPGASVKGMDIVGAIRYYMGTPNVVMEVKGFGNTINYGSCSGCSNRVYSIADFPGAGSDLAFYKASFSVTVQNNGSGQKFTYTKL